MMDITKLVDKTLLKEFYDVSDDDQLIVAMFNHINKLRDKLDRLQPPEPAVRQVRA